VGRTWVDPLQLFAVSVAGCIAAVLFLLAVLADVTFTTAATRAIVGWMLLSACGIGLTMLVRWILQVPRR
jgi:hypothetical protein